MRRHLLGAGLLVLLAAAVFGQAVGHGFLVYDDDVYVTANPEVRRGLSAQGAAWALTAVRGGIWHPLTWLSHMADWQLFGEWAGGHHLAAVLLHLLASLLLWRALAALTGSPAAGLLAASLHLVHPLHLESVLWISERKDLLAGLFFVLALLLYARHVRRPSPASLVPVAGAMALGLLSKPMVVTLPLVLLLLDRWPLGRLGPSRAGRPGHPRDTAAVVAEKIPLLVLGAAGSALAFLAQRAGGAVESLELLPLPWRLANAVRSCALYLARTFVPAGLSAFYPHPGSSLPPWQTVLSLALLGTVTWAALLRRRGNPSLLTGWAWFLLTLLPVIGLVQVGMQGMADRYTYLPLGGLFLALAWETVRSPVLRKRPASTTALAAASLLLLAALAHRQAGFWRDDLSLFGHALRVTRDNWLAEYQYGVALSAAGRHAEAARHYEAALRLRPQLDVARNNLWIARTRAGEDDPSLLYHREELRKDPGNRQALLGLAASLRRKGELPEAAAVLERALVLHPADAHLHNNLGGILLEEGLPQRAIPHFRDAVRLEPGLVEAQLNWGLALERTGARSEAAERYRAALRLRPDHPAARELLKGVGSDSR
jgi:tetratricopeptide (TPR) repeat protein